MNVLVAEEIAKQLIHADKMATPGTLAAGATRPFLSFRSLSFGELSAILV